MANHRAIKPRDTAGPELAIISLAAGVVGLTLAFVPGVNVYSGAAAAAGAAIGLVGIWLSRQVLSGVGVVLCGTAIVVTILAMWLHDRDADQRMDQQVHYELDLPIERVGSVVPDGC